MNVSRYLRDLPLRAQLMLAFALLSVATTVIATMTLVPLSAGHMQATLRERSVRIGTRLQSQLEPIVATNDRVAVREMLQSYAGDKELDGIGVYADDGALIEGRGIRPDKLRTEGVDPRFEKNHVIFVAPVEARDGRTGRLYLSFSTALNTAAMRHDGWIAAAVGGGVVLCALLLAAHTSRRISRRLVRIAHAADKMAAGDLSQPPLDDQAKDEIGALARAFNVMVSELNRVSTEHERLVLTERERLEGLVAERTRDLQQSREMFQQMAESTNSIPFSLDLTRGRFTYIGSRGVADSGVTESEWHEPGVLERVIPRGTNPEVRQYFDTCESGPFEFVAALSQVNGRRAEVRWTGTCDTVGGTKYIRGVMLDITEMRRRAREVSEAQKLESVGRLAAGVAHEINTPVQFVSDSVSFVRTSMSDITTVIHAYRELQRTVQSGGDVAAAAQLAAAAEKTADLDYIMENSPAAIESAIEGLGRITTIVRSMKEFAHPDQAQKALGDLNQAIRSTLVIANNEYKYVAQLDTHFGDLPPVLCYLGEINQVILNLLVNASHAISDVVKDTGKLGKLTVRTRLDGDTVEISIGDSGTGIPEAARSKIFDPFFTTKEVGKGTGQGLAIAHSVIVIKHGGTLHFETECGVGTTFYIRLPIEPPVAMAAQAAA